MAKRYGLILPGSKGAQKVNPPTFNSTKNVFGDDGSDSDDEGPLSKRKAPLRPSDNIKRQARLAQKKALEEDPTVYQYDELYDDMSSKKIEEKQIAKAEKKPKYIEKLLDAASKRKRENERRLERQVQKEREEEGDKFADKEAFVTSAYKKKLEELRLEEEKEKREDYLEAIGDVTKQKDLDGFYRHLYEQRLQPEKYNERLQKQNQTKSEDKDDIKANEEDTTPQGSKRKSEDGSQTEQNKKQRIYRKRISSSGHNEKDKMPSDDDKSDNDEINKVTIEDLKAGNRPQTHLQSNLDADSDFSIDSSSSEDEEDSKKKVSKEVAIPEVTKVEESKGEVDKFKAPMPIKKEISPIEKPEALPQKVEKIEEKPKIDIWKKRTVGVIFDEALKRYYERKASRCR